jgi:hypothetical protein
MSSIDEKLVNKCIDYIIWNQNNLINTENYGRECYNTLRWQLLINLFSRFINQTELSIYYSRIQSEIMNYNPIYKDGTFKNQEKNNLYLQCFEYNLKNTLNHSNFSNQTKQNIIDCLDILLNTNVNLIDINNQHILHHEQKIILFHKKIIPHFILWIKESNKTINVIDEIRKFCELTNGYNFNYSIDYKNYNYVLFLIDLDKTGLFQMQNIQILENIINSL